jgi:phosphoribosylglycinamide formyltransferase 1
VSQKARLAVFVSGSGTNLQALIDKECHRPDWPLTLAAVVSDKPLCRGVARAREAGIAVWAQSPRDFTDKSAFEQAVLAFLDGEAVEWIALAGYMRIVGPTLLSAYAHRIVNIHPSYLPAFPGARAVRDALAAGAAATGVTVHLVDEGVDTGPIVLQEEVEIVPGSSEEALLERIHAVEHRLYSAALEHLIRQH